MSDQSSEQSQISSEIHGSEPHSHVPKQRPPAPPQPMAFLKWAAQQKGPIGGDLLSDKLDSDDESARLFELMSYNKLFKSIEANHPVDPETRLRYKFSERITVKDFEGKLTDVCGCIRIKNYCKMLFKMFKKAFLPAAAKKEIPKPPNTLGLVAEDGSSDEGSGEDEDKGLTKCSQSLGDGATLYLQMMYTLTIMFGLLTIFNIPIYLFYENNTQGNNLSDMQTFFKYFTIGNLGQLTRFCGYSDFKYKFDPNQGTPENVDVDCGEGVIEKIINFGFMFNYDQQYGGFANGTAMCYHIENPMETYKWQEPEEITCDEDELGPYQYEICEVDLQVQKGLLTEIEAEFQYCLIDKDGDEKLCLPSMDYEDITTKAFQNNEKIAELLLSDNPDQNSLDTNYVWITNPLCDKLNYIWNDKRGRSLELTAVADEDNVSLINYLEVKSNGEIAASGSIPDRVSVLYNQDDGTLISISLFLNDVEFLYDAQDSFDINFSYQTDDCQDNFGRRRRQMAEEGHGESGDEQKLEDGENIEDGNPLDTSLYVKTGEVPELPNTDQFQTYANIDPLCGFSNHSSQIKRSKLFEDRDSQEMFIKYFDENCYGKKACTLVPQDMGYQIGDIVDNQRKVKEEAGLFGLISNNCKLRMSDEGYGNITSQTYIGIFGCKYDDIQMPFSEERVHKEVIGVVVVTCDFVSIIFMIYFFNKLGHLNKEFLECIDDLRVQMKDFGVIMQDVQLDRYTYDSRLIKMKIWLHFDELLKSKRDSYNNMQCIDVCLSIYSQPSIQLVFRMQEIQLVINHIKTRLLMNEYKNNKIADKQEELRFLLEKKERFERRYQTLVQKVAHDSKTENVLNVQRIPKMQRLKQVQYVYVVFKNCETASVVEKIYEKVSGPIALVQFCGKTFMPQSFSDNKIFGKNVDIQTMIEPDEIIWENLVYTLPDQNARKFATQIFSTCFLVFNTAFTIYLAGFKMLMNRKIPDPIGCPDIASTMEEAYLDYMKDYDEFSQTKSTGLLGCFCKETTSLFLPWTLVGHNFSEFSDTNDSINHCARWQGLQILKSLSLSFVGSSAVLINELVAIFFQYSGKFQKKHTKIEEQITVFKLIFTQEYINMAIIVLITSFDQMGVTEAMLGEYAEDNAVYNNFSANWYMDYGNQICIFIFMSSFVINSAGIYSYLRVETFRCYDRKGRMNLKLDPEDEDCDRPNTRQRVQSRLEELYTGQEFQGEKAFSRMMSTLFVIQMYSSGMPIMYMIGFIFFSVTYAVNKYLLINFYQKSRTLTRSIPIFSVSYLKYGIALHMGVAAFMLTNKEGFETESLHQGVQPMIDFETRQQSLVDEGTLDQESIDQGSAFRDRFQFMHQQLYILYIVTLILGILIGKNFYIILSLMISGIKKSISACILAAKKTIKLQIDYFSSKRRMQVERQKQSVADNLKMRLGNQLNLNQKDKFKKTLLRIQQKKLREAEQKEYEQRKADELEKCKGHLEIQQLLKSHIVMDLQRELQEQQRIKKEQEEDLVEVVDVEKVKREEEQFKEMQRQQLKEQKAKEAAEEKKAQIYQLTKRFERPDYSDNILIELSTESLSNFYQRCQRELSDFWEIFQYNDKISENLLDPDNTSPYKDLFLETCYTYRISVDETFKYQAYLIQRIKDVEAIIDKYMSLLKNPLREKMKIGFERDRMKRKKENKDGCLKDQVAQTKYEEWFMKYSDEVQFDDPKCYPYCKKMRILIHYQDELIAADCNRKDNKLNKQDICRMTGSISQSYFIFDAQQYKVGRKIYYGLEKEDADGHEHSLEDQDDNSEDQDAQDDLGDQESQQRSQTSKKSKPFLQSKSIRKSKQQERKPKRDKSDQDKSERVSRYSNNKKALKSLKTQLFKDQSKQWTAKDDEKQSKDNN